MIRFSRLALGALFCAALAGCQQDEIVTRRLPKEEKPRAAAASRPIRWTVPAGWKEQAPSSMRTGSFLVLGKNGSTAEVSIVPLRGEAGGDLANVNRWRGQLNLRPITEAELPKMSRRVEAGGQSMLLVDFVSKDILDNKFKKRIVACVGERGEQSWFFKMMGEDATVAAAKPDFLRFLKSVEFRDPE